MVAGYGKVVRQLLTDYANGKTVTQISAWFIGLSTANPGDSMAGLAEPTISTGGYARVASLTQASWTAAPSPADDAAVVGANAVAFTFPVSTAAWSTTTTALTYSFVSTSATATTSAAMVSRQLLTPATTTVNAAGITLSFAIAAFTTNIIPA